MNVAQHLGSAVAATATARTDAELRREIFERANAVFRAFAHGPFGDGVAKADVHD